MDKPRVLVAIRPSLYRRISTSEDRARLASLADVVEWNLDRNMTVEELRDRISGFDAVLTSWGSPRFTKEVMENADRLKIVAYAAGSVRPIVSYALWDKGVVVVNAAHWIAYAMAERTVANMINALQHIPQIYWSTREQKPYDPGIFPRRLLMGKKVGVIGVGHIGTRVVQLLKPFNVEIMVYDPFLNEEKARELGVTKVALEKIFAECDVIADHTPSNESARCLIKAEHLKMMKDGAILVTTAHQRPVQIMDIDALVEEVKKGRIMVVFETKNMYERRDVVEALRGLNNAIALGGRGVSGTSGGLMSRLVGYVLDDLELFFKGKKPRKESTVTKEDLIRLA